MRLAGGQLTATPAPDNVQPPSVDGAACGAAAVCRTLLSMYRATSAQNPWVNATGWDSAAANRSAACDAPPYASPADAGAAPAFCGWNGVLCCDFDVSDSDLFDRRAVERATPPHCTHPGAVTALHLPRNGLNGELQDLVGPLLHLNACGLRDLSLPANELAGALPRAFGQLTGLRSGRCVCLIPTISYTCTVLHYMPFVV